MRKLLLAAMWPPLQIRSQSNNPATTWQHLSKTETVFCSYSTIRNKLESVLRTVLSIKTINRNKRIQCFSDTFMLLVVWRRLWNSIKSLIEVDRISMLTAGSFTTVFNPAGWKIAKASWNAGQQPRIIFQAALEGIAGGLQADAVKEDSSADHVTGLW